MKISVVMTTCNGERYLDQQIRSVLDQTLPPDEIIVCDDCSADGTLAILERYYQQKKLTYFINDRQLGLIKNFKKVVSLANENNAVALCDQDDEWLPDKLEKSVALLQRMNNDLPCMVHTDLMLVDEEDNILNSSFRNELGQDNYQHNLQTLLFGNFVTGCTIMMNPRLRTLFAEMPENIPFHDAWIALAAFTFGEVKEVPEALIRYRKHGNNLSIAADTKPRNRYRSTMNEILTAFKGKDDFLLAQMEMVSSFYTRYHDQLSADKRIYFDQFLRLRKKPYLVKKLAFRKMVKQFRA